MIAALTEMVDDAPVKGAEVLTGGQRLGNIRYFFKSTVLTNVPGDALIMREEPFGPIAILNTVASLDEAIAQANSVEYGLAGYAFTNRVDFAARLADDIEVGNFSINTLEASMPETLFGGEK